MAITASMVKELRERTGAGMMECKKALVESDGDLDAAAEALRKAGAAKADKKAGRVAADGRVVIKQDGSKASIVEVNSETDFVAKDENFVAFAESVADVVLAENGPAHRAELLVAQADVERRTRAVAAAGAPPLAVVAFQRMLHLRGAHAGNGRPATLLKGFVDVVVVGRRDDEPVSGYGAQKVIELGLDGGEVGEDVRVVVLQVVDDQGTRVVVNELGSSVEVGAVVLVGLHHEEGVSAQPR